MLLLSIVLGTLASGIGSVWLAAALLRFTDLARSDSPTPQHLLSLAAGSLLATSFMHLLPEAFESGLAVHGLFATLLGGLVFFFLLDKAELYHHGHEHHVDSADEADAHTPAQVHEHVHAQAHIHVPGPGHRDAQVHTHLHAQGPVSQHARPAHTHAHGRGWAVLLGDSLHSFGDGILMAAAFTADLHLGLAAALAVLAHEVPHHMGDLVVLRQASGRQALAKVSLTGAITALGGVLGWSLLDSWHAALPFVLTLASSSFVYVALADLIPQLQKRLPARQTLAQVLWLLGGIAMVTLVTGWSHTH